MKFIFECTIIRPSGMSTIDKLLSDANRGTGFFPIRKRSLGKLGVIEKIRKFYVKDKEEKESV